MTCNNWTPSQLKGIPTDLRPETERELEETSLQQQECWKVDFHPKVGFYDRLATSDSLTTCGATTYSLCLIWSNEDEALQQ